MIRRCLVAALASLALAGPLRAQDKPEAKRDALVAQEWFQKGGWTHELAKAKDEARKSGKLIFVYYTVVERESPFCRKLEATLFTDEKFLAWSRKFVPYCQISWDPKDRHDELHAARGNSGWPWFAFIDSNGALIYPLRPTLAFQAYEEAGARVLGYLEASRRVQTGGDSEKRDLIIAALDLGKISAESAHARLSKLGALGDAQKKALEQAESNAFVMEIALATSPADPNALVAAGEKFLEHWRAKKPLPTARADIQSYFIAILKVAEMKKDAALYKEALAELEKRYASDPNTKGFFDGCKKTLAQLEGSK